MSAGQNVFDNYDDGSSAAAYQQQQAAIEALRAKQAASKGPQVFFPFGKTQPLAKYAGMAMLPFTKNEWVDRPERILLAPEPGARYGWVKKDDPRIRGMIRSHKYNPVYLDELIPTNDAAISTETFITEAGPNGEAPEAKSLVLWSGLMLIRISQRAYYELYEVPALMSTVRLSQHMLAINNLGTVGPDGQNYSDLRGKALVDAKIIDVG